MRDKKGSSKNAKIFTKATARKGGRGGTTRRSLVDKKQTPTFLMAKEINKQQKKGRRRRKMEKWNQSKDWGGKLTTQWLCKFPKRKRGGTELGSSFWEGRQPWEQRKRAWSLPGKKGEIMQKNFGIVWKRE